MGIIAYGLLCYAVPYIRKRSDRYEADDKSLRVRKYSGNKYLDYIFPLSTYPNGKPKGRVYFLLYLFSRGSVYVGLVGYTLDQIGAKALVSPLTWNGLQYDILFARSSDTPNGSHVFSALGIPLVGLLVIYLYRDEFLGALASALIVGIHELFWEAFYYFDYAKYLSWNLLTYVLKDISFSIMLILFILAWWKYPAQKIPFRIMLPPILVVLSFLFWWQSIGFPITTINNYLYGQTVYNITEWWPSPFVNGIEVGSWVILEVSIALNIILFWWMVNRLKKPVVP